MATTRSGMTSTEASQAAAGFAERDLTVRGYALVGSPATVRQQLERCASELGFGIFCGIGQFGSLGHEEFERSVRLFADGVMPALRPAGDGRT
jgi:alkanesulfonate monooxygenase SsuD/methylene tetrahydromethanopterin reductase-like flavin-dependent oxidoreductase (luciferase family)